MSNEQRMMRLLTANPATLARVDAVLNGTDSKPTKDDDVRLCTYTEAAKKLNLSRPTIYRLVQAGRLETVHLNGTRRIKLKSIAAFIEGTNN